MIIIEAVFERRDGYDVDFDGNWKKIISELFEEFILFFAPDLHKIIDFTHVPEFLQQELFQDIIENKKGKRFADQIIKVRLKNGEEQWVLIHIEIQGKSSEVFSERMFRYFYRMFDRYNQKIYALALITDDKPRKYDHMYLYDFHGTKVSYSFNVYNFHEQQIKDLEKSSNPFAIAVIAGKYATQFRHDVEQRFHFKRELVHHLLKTHPQSDPKKRKYLSVLLQFIYFILRLPDGLEEKLEHSFILTMKKEGENPMNNGTTKTSPTSLYEKLVKEFGWEAGVEEGRKQGIEQGIEKNKVDMAKKLIAENFPLEKISDLVGLDLNEVKEISENELSDS